MLIGYARTSAVEQVAGLEAQQASLAAAGCNKVFSERASSVAQRDQLIAALDFVREGGTLILTRLDRLARSAADLLGIVALLERKQMALRILDLGGTEVDTRSLTGRMLLTMFAAAAEFGVPVTRNYPKLQPQKQSPTLSALLVWTASDGIAMCHIEVVEISIEEAAHGPDYPYRDGYVKACVSASRCERG